MDSADMKYARHAKFQEKEKNSDHSIEYFPGEFFFRRKIKKASK